LPHHVHARCGDLVDHDTALARVLQQLDDLAAHRAEAGHHDGPAAAYGQGQPLHRHQVGRRTHGHQDRTRLHHRGRPLGGGERAGPPLADDGHTVLLTQPQFAQALAGQRTAGAHAKLGQTDGAAQQVHAFGRRADAHAGARGQSATQHMRRREDVGGADLDHRRAVQRLVGQREQRAREAQFAHDHRAAGVGVVTGVADHGPGLRHPGQGRLPFGQLAMHDAVATIAQLARLHHVLLEDDEGAAIAHEFLQQRLDGGAVTVEEHHTLHGRQHVRQLGFELLLEVGQHEDREDQEHQEVAHELPDDDEQRHRRGGSSGCRRHSRWW
jgi:hypothetical protein